MVIENSTDFKVRCYHGHSKNLKDHDDWNMEIELSEVRHALDMSKCQILFNNLYSCDIKYVQIISCG